MALRSLGPMEMFSYTRHQLGIYRAVVVTARYVFPPTPDSMPMIQEKTPDLLYSALAVVVAKHPMLRVGLTTGHLPGENPSYCHLSQVDLKRHVSFAPGVIPQGRQDVYVDQMVGEQHDQLFDHVESRPAWRLVWAPNTHTQEVNVLFAFHHSLSGGMGGVVFHQDLIAALNSVWESPPPSSGRVASTLTFSDSAIVPKSQEQVISHTLSFFFLLSTIVSALLLPRLPALVRAKPAPTFTGRDIDFSLPYVTKVRSLDLPAAQLAVVLQQCKRRQVTLTALIHALCAASLAGQIEPDHGLSSDTAISLDRFLPASEKDVSKLRVLLSTVNHDFSVQTVSDFRGVMEQLPVSLDPKAAPTPSSPLTAVHPTPDKAQSASDSCQRFDEAIWASSSVVKQDIAARLADEESRNDVSFMLKHISNWDTFWRGKDGQKRDSTFSVSNVGVFHNPALPTAGRGQPEGQEVAGSDKEAAEGPTSKNSLPVLGGERGGEQLIKATRLLFTNASMVAGAAIGVNLASVKGGGFTLAVTWQMGVVNDEIAERMGREVLACLERLADTGTFCPASPGRGIAPT